MNNTDLSTYLPEIPVDFTPQSSINSRVLKVAEIGDFWRKRTTPAIRLQGKWMAQAGLLPNRYVQVFNPCPGVLVIHILEDCYQPAQTALR